MINSNSNEEVSYNLREPKNIAKVVIDIFCLVLVILPILLLKMVASPFSRGFYCNDESLNYPFYGSTITNYLLYSFGTFVPIIVITSMEFINALLPYKSKLNKDVVLRKLPSIFLNLYKLLGWFIFGAFVSMTITDIGKYTIGRLRPHFFDVCRPAIDLGPSTCINNPMFLMPTSIDCRPNIYYTNYVCCGNDQDLINEVRLSFPSGHSSFSFYTMIYLALYLQQRFIYSPSSLFKPVFQAFAIICAFFTALSRIMNSKHHPIDVLTGALIGTITVLVLIKFCRPFDPLKTSSSKPNKNGNIEVGETEVKLRAGDDGAPEEGSAL